MSKELFFVEGEVTDLFTRETMQNLNANSQNNTGAIAVGSALAGAGAILIVGSTG